ncbi:MAG: hypothetical protein GY730_08280 [bacterium]|nr:hypothetical protein [bacterium]
MQRQIADEKLTEYTREYLEKYPEIKRGPKTPEGIAKAAKNLVRKRGYENKKLLHKHFAFELSSLDKDKNYSNEQQLFFKNRYKKLTMNLEEVDPYYESLIHFIILQELQMKQHYRVLNSSCIKPNEIERTQKLLNQCMNAYNKLFDMLSKQSTKINMELKAEFDKKKEEQANSSKRYIKIDRKIHFRTLSLKLALERLEQYEKVDKDYYYSIPQFNDGLD